MIFCIILLGFYALRAAASRNSHPVWYSTPLLLLLSSHNGISLFCATNEFPAFCYYYKAATIWLLFAFVSWLILALVVASTYWSGVHSWHSMQQHCMVVACSMYLVACCMVACNGQSNSEGNNYNSNKCVKAPVDYRSYLRDCACNLRASLVCCNYFVRLRYH